MQGTVLVVLGGIALEASPSREGTTRDDQRWKFANTSRNLRMKQKMAGQSKRS